MDQGLSLTLFFPDTATTRDLNKAQIYAWRKGIKTLYYIRIRQQALEGTGSPRLRLLHALIVRGSVYRLSSALDVPSYAFGLRRRSPHALNNQRPL